MNYKTTLTALLKDERAGVLEYERLLMHLKRDKVAQDVIAFVEEVLAEEKVHARIISKLLRSL